MIHQFPAIAPLRHGDGDGMIGAQGEGLGQVPEQPVQVAHHGEDREHLVGDLGYGAPVPATEGHLGDPLAGAEAVVHGAAREPARPEVRVDAAAEVVAQVGARRSGRFRQREVSRGDERGHDAAEPEAPRAVSAQRTGIDHVPTLDVHTPPPC